MESGKSKVTLWAPTPQNGQPHSNDSSAFADEYCLNVFDHFVELSLKGLTWKREISELIFSSTMLLELNSFERYKYTRFHFR